MLCKGKHLVLFFKVGRTVEGRVHGSKRRSRRVKIKKCLAVYVRIQFLARQCRIAQKSRQKPPCGRANPLPAVVNAALRTKRRPQFFFKIRHGIYAHLRYRIVHIECILQTRAQTAAHGVFSFFKQLHCITAKIVTRIFFAINCFSL